jgi:N6-L-threonylcarbamoyladenine synthase
MGLPYPGGPLIDKLSKEGNPDAFPFPEPHIQGLDYSFSGLKTSFLYFLRDRLKEDQDFIGKNQADLAASIQQRIISILLKKLELAAQQTGIREIAIAGGVSANSGLRNTLQQRATQKGWKLYLPNFSYSTDNAAMIAMAGVFKFAEKDFSGLDAAPYARATSR